MSEIHTQADHTHKHTHTHTHTVRHLRQGRTCLDMAIIVIVLDVCTTHHRLHTTQLLYGVVYITSHFEKVTITQYYEMKK